MTSLPPPSNGEEEEHQFHRMMRALHRRERPLYIANVIVAIALFGLLIASLVFMIVDHSSIAKNAVDYTINIFFFIAVLLLLVGEIRLQQRNNELFAR